jgi:hypothetical protein
VEVGVIVSITPPEEFASGQPFGLYDDVWVTNQGAALPLAETLRSQLIAVQRAIAPQRHVRSLTFHLERRKLLMSRDI